MGRSRNNVKNAQGSLLTADGVHEAVIPVEEQPYPLPEGWKWVKLYSLCSLRNGKAFKPSDWSDSGLPIVRIQNLNNPDSKFNYYNGPIEDIFLLKSGDLLFAWSGTPGTSFGAHIWLGGKAILNQHIFRMDFEEKVILKSFFRYSINCRLEELIAKAHGGAGLQHVTKGVFENTPIALPPLDEQQRIVEHIESLFAKLDEAKAKAKAVLNGFESRKAAILHKAFTGELTAKWRNERGVTKESWQILPFEKCVSNMQNGISKRKGNFGRDYIVLRLTNLVNNKITFEDFNTITLDNDEIKKYSLNKNDILMIRVNGSKNNVGKQFMVEEDNKYAFCDHIIRIKYDISKIDNTYAFLFSQGNYYKYYVQNNMVSSAGQNTISRKGLANLAIPLPTIPEQKEIIRLLESLLENEQQVRDAAENVLERIDLMKKAILARAFRGELTRHVHN